MNLKEMIEKINASGKANIDYEKVKEAMDKKMAEIKAATASQNAQNKDDQT